MPPSNSSAALAKRDVPLGFVKKNSLAIETDDSAVRGFVEPYSSNCRATSTGRITKKPETSTPYE
jgi:hypothetical protein